MSWPSDVVSGALIEAADINAAYLAVRVWGGTVNAASNAILNLAGLSVIPSGSMAFQGAGSIDALGVLTLQSAGNELSLPGPIKCPVPSSTTGSQATVQMNRWVESNAIYLETVAHRHTTGSGHVTDEWHIRRRVDATLMGYVGWGSNYVSIGNGAGIECLRVSNNSRLKLATQTTYGTDGAAGSGGLVAGEVYWDSSGFLRRKQ